MIIKNKSFLIFVAFIIIYVIIQGGPSNLSSQDIRWIVMAFFVAVAIYMGVNFLRAIWTQKDTPEENIPSENASEANTETNSAENTTQVSEETTLEENSTSSNQETTTHKKTSIPLVVAVLLGVIVFFIILGNVMLYNGIKEIQSRSVKTPATVTAIDKTYKQNTAYFSLQIQFEANGQTIKTYSDTAVSPRPSIKVGDTVTTYYDPDNPKSVFILGFDSFGMLWFGVIAFLIVELPVIIASFCYAAGPEMRSKMVKFLEDNAKIIQTIIVCLFIPFWLFMLYIGFSDDTIIDELILDLLL